MGALQQFSMARGYTLGLIKRADEHAWDAQPEGFSNTVQWNVGHIYSLTEDLLNRAMNDYPVDKLEWAEFFAPGTSPSTWPSTPPAKEELIVAMKGQGKRISQLTELQLSHRLNTPISIGKFITLETVEEVLQFLTWHEGMHAGLIDGLLKASR
ncbi:DinB family protein [Sporosarcina ureae]|uniref:DinB family protein n=1 Tax=Sporosarcina ureae TaxID=1571 RepID=UPI0026F1FCB0|nr:DinB family protein [Sporosarcina ureae]